MVMHYHHTLVVVTDINILHAEISFQSWLIKDSALKEVDVMYDRP